jgi:hypothetical protein
LRVVVHKSERRMRLELGYSAGFDPAKVAKGAREEHGNEFTQLHIIVSSDGLENVTPDKRTSKIADDIRKFTLAIGASSQITLSITLPHTDPLGYWNAFLVMGAFTNEDKREFQKKEEGALDTLFRIVSTQCGGITLTASSPLRHARFRLRVSGTDRSGPFQAFVSEYKKVEFQRLMKLSLIWEIDLKYEPGAPELILGLSTLFENKNKRTEIHVLRITGTGGPSPQSETWRRSVAALAGMFNRGRSHAEFKTGIETLIFEDTDGPTMMEVREALSPREDRWSANVGTLRRLVVRTTQSRILPDVLREIVQFIPEKSGDKKDEERDLRGVDKRELDIHFDKIGEILKLAQSVGWDNVPKKELAECAYHALYGLRTGRLTGAKKRFELACQGKRVPDRPKMVGDPEFQGDEQIRMAEEFYDKASDFLAELARRPPKEEGASKGGKVNPAMEAHRNELVSILGPSFPTFRYLQQDRTFPTLLSLVIEDNGPGDEILPDRIWYEQELLRIAYAATPSQPLSILKDKKGETKGAQFFGLYELSLSGTRLGQHATMAMTATMLVSRCLTRLSLFKAGTNGDWNGLANALPMMRILQTDDISLRTVFSNRPVPQGELPMIILSLKAPLQPWYRKIGYADGRALPSVPASERGTRLGRQQVEVARILATFTARVRRAIAAGVVNAEVAVAAALQDNDIGLTEAESLMMAEDHGTSDVPVHAPAPAPAPAQPPAPAPAPRDDGISRIEYLVSNPNFADLDEVNPRDVDGGSGSPPPVPVGENRHHESLIEEEGERDTRNNPSSTFGRSNTQRQEPRPSSPAEDMRDTRNNPSSTRQDELPDMELEEAPPRMVPSGREKRQKYATPPAEYEVPVWVQATPAPPPPPPPPARAPAPKPASPSPPPTSPGWEGEWDLPDKPTKRADFWNSVWNPK